VSKLRCEFVVRGIKGETGKLCLIYAIPTSAIFFQNIVIINSINLYFNGTCRRGNK
jgi:hypothetical protein